MQSYVNGDRITCIYIAPNEDRLREHADRGGFPVNRVMEIVGIIDPTTAESRPFAEL
ncbi:MAG TPA: nickel-binding protein [Gemmatimonadaceae bacterium]|nr:nickel-binding protein [Gemmatimonadaceae bacterium]